MVASQCCRVSLKQGLRRACQADMPSKKKKKKGLKPVTRLKDWRPFGTGHVMLLVSHLANIATLTKRSTSQNPNPYPTYESLNWPAGHHASTGWVCHCWGTQQALHCKVHGYSHSQQSGAATSLGAASQHAGCHLSEYVHFQRRCTSAVLWAGAAHLEDICRRYKPLPPPPPPTSKSCCKIENCPPPPQPPPHATPKLCYKIETCPPPPPHAIPKPCCKIENCPPPPNPRPTPPQNLVAKLRATAGVLLWVGAAFLKTCVALKVLLGLQIWKHAAAVLLVDAAICLSVVSLSGRRKVKPAVTHAGMSLTGPNI